MANFTFKTEKPEGRYRSFFRTTHHIKLNKINVGQIDFRNGKWKVSFMLIKSDIMEDDNPNCVWMWKRLVPEFDNVEQAKSWVKVNSDYIQQTLPIYIGE